MNRLLSVVMLIGLFLVISAAIPYYVFLHVLQNEGINLALACAASLMLFMLILIQKGARNYLHNFSVLKPVSAFENAVNESFFFLIAIIFAIVRNC